MPLVTLTCSTAFYPPDEPADAPIDHLMTEQRFVVELANVLPGLIVANTTGLNLDPAETPEEGVQVDIKKFHGRGRNTVDLWVHVVFAEPYPGEVIGMEVRATLIKILTAWRQKLFPLKLTAALDIFWGPEHGCLIPDMGAITIFW